MVWVKNVGMKAVYVCDVCGFGYDNPKTAIKCEQFCRENKVCSPEITRKAVYKP